MSYEISYTMPPSRNKKIGEREIEVGYITYDTLSFYVGDMVICNAMGDRWGSTMEMVSGNLETEDGYPKDIFQFFIIRDSGGEFLQDYAPDEPVFYDEELNVYVWGITFYGTSWDYVYSGVKVEKTLSPNYYKE